MQSLIHRLVDKKNNYKIDKVSRSDLFGKGSEHMIHVAHVSKDTIPCRMYQIVFTGDRVLDIELIGKLLGEDHLSVRSAGNLNRSTIQMPLTEQDSSDFITVFDESILEKETVHVAKGINNEGVWISPNEIISLFQNYKILPVSTLANTEGLNLDTNGEGFKKEMLEIKSHLSKHMSAKDLPVLFDSTRKEIDLMDTDDIDFLEEIIDIDPYIYGHILMNYYKNGGRTKSPSIYEMITEIGPRNIYLTLKELTLPGGSVSPLDVNFSIGESVYKNISIITFLMTEILKTTKSKLGIAPRLGGTLGRLIGYNTARWLCDGGADKSLDLSDQMKINRHRYLPDIQKKFRGFTQISLSSYIMEEFNVSEDIAIPITNHWNPFYQGEHFVTCNLLYIVRAKMDELDILDIRMFSPVSRIHNILARNLGVENEINAAFEKLDTALEHTERMSWRFR
ncbi:hypothetical protein [Psychromonas sp. SP041]|uniref:hypothetical protein n=1 Tax=Psychromonas sp. SP041 TaxID=1365007 RepID=UPI000415A070|nr:hypothetical protein [Psychromonas sp. SP041]